MTYKDPRIPNGGHTHKVIKPRQVYDTQSLKNHYGGHTTIVITKNTVHFALVYSLQALEFDRNISLPKFQEFQPFALEYSFYGLRFDCTQYGGISLDITDKMNKISSVYSIIRLKIILSHITMDCRGHTTIVCFPLTIH